jgi:hypothetical protein
MSVVCQADKQQPLQMQIYQMIAKHRRSLQAAQSRI